jgi:hypothetical protein
LSWQVIVETRTSEFDGKPIGASGILPVAGRSVVVLQHIAA